MTRPERYTTISKYQNQKNKTHHVNAVFRKTLNKAYSVK